MTSSSSRRTDWFNFFYLSAAAGFVALLIVHLRRSLALVPSTWLGRGQLLYLLVLWSFVLGNLSKQLPAFRQGRLITEGVILINAVIVTMLILAWRQTTCEVTALPAVDFRRRIRRAALAGVLVCVATTAFETWTVRQVYGDRSVGMRGPDLRFGPKANARVKPLLKGTAHR